MISSSPNLLYMSCTCCKYGPCKAGMGRRIANPVQACFAWPVLDVISLLYKCFEGPVLVSSTGPAKQVWIEGYHINAAVFPPFVPTCKAGLYLMRYPPLQTCFVGPVLDASIGPAKKRMGIRKSHQVWACFAGPCLMWYPHSILTLLG